VLEGEVVRFRSHRATLKPVPHEGYLSRGDLRKRKASSVNHPKPAMSVTRWNSPARSTSPSACAKPALERMNAPKKTTAVTAE
jgi:hypothetical protein